MKKNPNYQRLSDSNLIKQNQNALGFTKFGEYFMSRKEENILIKTTQTTQAVGLILMIEKNNSKHKKINQN